MKRFKLFWKEGCHYCPEAKKVAGMLSGKYEVIKYDINTSEGLAEATFHNVKSTPTLILVDAFDRILRRWTGNSAAWELILP